MISLTDVILAEVWRQVRSWWLPKLRSKEVMSDEYQAYAILTMTRIMYGIIKRDEISKKDSGAWFLNSYPKFKTLVEDALNWQSGVSLDRQDEVYDLIEFVHQVIVELPL